jgi:hypothetical protein
MGEQARCSHHVNGSIRRAGPGGLPVRLAGDPKIGMVREPPRDNSRHALRWSRTVQTTTRSPRTRPLAGASLRRLSGERLSHPHAEKRTFMGPAVRPA